MTTKEVIQQPDSQEITIEEKLRAMYKLQIADSEIDKIRILRGELPLEVQDLEDEIEGLETRVNNYENEIKEFEKLVAGKKNEIKEAQNLIKKYHEQQNNVRNNREYDSLSKEIEFQTLEIDLCEKRIREYTEDMNVKTESITGARTILEERKNDLSHKKSELEEIIDETQKEEEDLLKNSAEISRIIEKRLLTAYRRIRKNARNGLAVVPIERDACGGCFNKIPPQRQLDIRSRKKIIVCEYCGRVLVDKDLADTI
ncbi:MAG: C4-type zinc ribbon domain-containing protein [Bacteroidota bacterium]